MATLRRPAVAGQFYEATKEGLKERIKECFLDKRGPGKLPTIKSKNNKIKGVIVPHAGYIYSGAIAAHSYDFIAQNGFSKTFIILGPNHTGYGSGVSIMTKGSWVTPLGNVDINQALAQKLCKEIIDNDENAHLYEHSIEVQLPFLQYISEEKDFNIIPICMAMQDFETSEEVGKIIAKEVKDLKEKPTIIASTDFSHAGFNYRSMPPAGISVDKYAKKQDEYAIEQILKLNPKGLIDIVYKKNISMCGYGPVAAMLTATKILGAKKAELLKYGSSYEVHPGSSCVGYAAVAVY